MPPKTIDRRSAEAASKWLKGYYFTRFAFSAVWVAIAFSVARNAPPLAAPHAGRLSGVGRDRQLRRRPAQRRTRPQQVATAQLHRQHHHGRRRRNCPWRQHEQRACGLRDLGRLRWHLPARHCRRTLEILWRAMGHDPERRPVRSGRRLHVQKWRMAPRRSVSPNIAPYAAFGAFYFLVSAIWLTVSDARKAALRTAN